MSTYLHAYTYKHTYKEQEWEEKEKAPSSWPNYFSIPNAGCTQTFNPWCMWVWSFPQNPSFVQYNSSSYLMSSYTDHIIPPPLNCVILFFPAFFYVSGFSWTYDKPWLCIIINSRLLARCLEALWWRTRLIDYKVRLQSCFIQNHKHQCLYFLFHYCVQVGVVPETGKTTVMVTTDF